jgi:hypothetical protein
LWPTVVWILKGFVFTYVSTNLPLSLLTMLYHKGSPPSPLPSPRGTGAWTQSLHLLGWLQIVILLISASWVPRITGVSHQHLAVKGFLVYSGSFWNRENMLTSGTHISAEWKSLNRASSRIFNENPFLTLEVLHTVQCILENRQWHAPFHLDHKLALTVTSESSSPV